MRAFLLPSVALLLISTVLSSAFASTPYEKGDEAFKRRKDPARAYEALTEYRQLHASNPQDPEAAWRLAMASYFVGIRLTEKRKEKKAIFDEGKKAGEAAVKNSENCAPCHFWYAINFALYGESVGIVRMLFALDDVQIQLRKSIAADPKYAGAGAMRLLGKIEESLPGILGGSDDRAREHYEKAILTDPNEPLNYLFLARLLEDEFDDEITAVEWAEKGIAVPTPSFDRLEAIDAIDELHGFLKKHSASAQKKKAKKAKKSNKT